MPVAAHYKDLGFANTKDMFKKAIKGKYAVPAFNFNNMEQLQGIILGCVESRSPVILQVSGSAMGLSGMLGRRSHQYCSKVLQKKMSGGRAHLFPFPAGILKMCLFYYVPPPAREAQAGPALDQ